MTKLIKLSRLGFGCASVMGKVGHTKSLRAMSEAFEIGVTHFDVARSYGFGEAESVLGGFLKGKRDKVTIATKFGVVPPNLRMTKRLAMPVARLASNIFPQLKSKLKKRSGELLAEKRFDVVYAQKCLDESLERLNTDYVDIYLLHDPDMSVLENADELRYFLDSMVSAGKINHWGVTYRVPEDYLETSQLRGNIAQFEGNFSTYAKCDKIIANSSSRIVTRPFLGGSCQIPALNEFFESLEVSTKMKKLGVNKDEVGLCLSARLAGEVGSVVCSMFSMHHIHRNYQILNEYYQSSEMQYILDKLTNKCKFG